MEDDRSRIDPDADEVRPACARFHSESTHPLSLRRVDRIDRLSATGDGPNFENDSFPVIQGKDVDLPAIETNIGGDHPKTVIV